MYLFDSKRDNYGIIWRRLERRKDPAIFEVPFASDHNLNRIQWQGWYFWIDFRYVRDSLRILFLLKNLWKYFSDGIYESTKCQDHSQFLIDLKWRDRPGVIWLIGFDNRHIKSILNSKSALLFKLLARWFSYVWKVFERIFFFSFFPTTNEVFAQENPRAFIFSQIIFFFFVSRPRIISCGLKSIENLQNIFRTGFFITVNISIPKIRKI